MSHTLNNRPLKILAIVAGTNDPSNSHELAKAFVEGASRRQKVDTPIVRLKDISLGHFNLSCYGPDCPIDDLTRVQTMITEADGIVIASPVWNFGVPAHLKNLIDRMGSFALDSSRSLGTLNGKPIYVIFTAGMPKAAWPFLRKSVSTVPLALQYFGGSVLGTHFEGSCTLGRGVFGLVVDKRPASLQSVKEQGAHFAKHVEAFVRTGKLPLKYILIKKFVRLSQLVKKKLGL